MFLKHQRKIKIIMRRRNLQRCHTDTREEEKGSKLKKTFAKTKNVCLGCYTTQMSFEKKRTAVGPDCLTAWRNFLKANMDGEIWLLEKLEEIWESKDKL